ncbi:Membrane protein involved in the export of O-antigen and teichoic acid [Chitinophaga terrae (ex Kim and Jung 2007)]|uniref:Membrane protein involved in the export of O-antigen and teichoic acid n=1 Tax=Chitinophaga terrae (ex Kim and Jung 2007) TaxID=408074 RepID=A0A1H3XXA1_9BACT|nr:oligosaccharide flippase family protein [Chitinophaga terrae (ex Kim and Jung 2007)]SEA04087.1 Membrane protein involved in the export of O-antigen and teichoic acid [Chitinophaga terrae (ex Kim and Jung 2007)]
MNLNIVKRILQRKEAQHFVNYYIFTIMGALVGFYSIPYLTRHIPPENYGMIGIFLGIVFFMPSLLSFSSNGLQAINIVDQAESEYKRFRNAYISFVIILSICCLAIAVALSYFWSDFGFVIVTAVIYGCLQLCSSIHSTELIQHGKPTQFGLFNFSTIALTFLLTVVSISGFHLDWKYRIYSIIITEAIMVILRFFLFSDIARSFKFTIDKKVIKLLLRYGWPLMFSVAAGWIINQSDRFILLHYYSLKEVGIYAAAYGIASIITTFNQTMIRVVAPPIYQNLAKRVGRSFITKLNVLYSIVILGIAAAGCLCLHLFWHLFLGAKYGASLPVIYVLCFAQAFFGIYMTLGIVIDYFKQNKLKTMIVWVSAIISICTSILLIPVLGAYAPAVGSFFSFLILAIITYIYSYQLLKKYNVT